MTNTKKFLAAGLLAGALTFIGCKSDSSAERTGDTTDTPQTTPPPATPAEGATPEGTPTETQPPPGTGGSGETGASKTKQSDDNLRMPEEDPLRTPESESVRDAESEPGVHEDPGTGGSGRDDDAMDDTDDNLNEGGNVDDMFRIPDSPADTTPEGPSVDESQIPEGTR